MKITTTINKKNLKDAFEVVFGINHRKINIISLIILTLIIIYGIFTNKNIIVNIIILVLMYAVYYCLFRFLNVKKQLKLSSKTIGKEVTYDFQEKQVHLTSSTTDEIYRYANFRQVINFRNYWYLIDNNRCLWIVEKPADKILLKQIDGILKNNQIKYIVKRTKFI